MPRDVAYAFVSLWRLPASPERVSALLADWGEGRRPLAWWHGVLISDPEPALERGGRITASVRSPLGYRLRVVLHVTSVAPGPDEPHRIAVRSTGSLEGAGALRIDPVPGGALLRIDWTVRTTGAWMNALAPVLRPAYAWAHRAIMRAGERGLLAELARAQ